MYDARTVHSIGVVVAPIDRLPQERTLSRGIDLEIEITGGQFGGGNVFMAETDQLGQQSPVGGQDPVHLAQFFLLRTAPLVVVVTAAAVAAETFVAASMDHSATLGTKTRHLFFRQR